MRARKKIRTQVPKEEMNKNIEAAQCSLLFVMITAVKPALFIFLLTLITT